MSDVTLQPLAVGLGASGLVIHTPSGRVSVSVDTLHTLGLRKIDGRACNGRRAQPADIAVRLQALDDFHAMVARSLTEGVSLYESSKRCGRSYMAIQHHIEGCPGAAELCKAVRATLRAAGKGNAA